MKKTVLLIFLFVLALSACNSNDSGTNNVGLIDISNITIPSSEYANYNYVNTIYTDKGNNVITSGDTSYFYNFYEFNKTVIVKMTNYIGAFLDPGQEKTFTITHDDKFYLTKEEMIDIALNKYDLASFNYKANMPQKDSFLYNWCINSIEYSKDSLRGIDKGYCSVKYVNEYDIPAIVSFNLCNDFKLYLVECYKINQDNQIEFVELSYAFDQIDMPLSKFLASDSIGNYYNIEENEIVI